MKKGYRSIFRKSLFFILATLVLSFGCIAYVSAPKSNAFNPLDAFVCLKITDTRYVNFTNGTPGGWIYKSAYVDREICGKGYYAFNDGEKVYFRYSFPKSKKYKYITDNVLYAGYKDETVDSSVSSGRTVDMEDCDNGLCGGELKPNFIKVPKKLQVTYKSTKKSLKLKFNTKFSGVYVKRLGLEKLYEYDDKNLSSLKLTGKKYRLFLKKFHMKKGNTYVIKFENFEVYTGFDPLGIDKTIKLKIKLKK
jgi:hypothetical protein